MKKDVVSTPNSKPVIWALEFFLNKVNVVVLGGDITVSWAVAPIPGPSL